MKAGCIPFVVEDGIIYMMFFIPSDPHYGGDRWQIAKGKVESSDFERESLREAKEELGLKKSNIKSIYSAGIHEFRGDHKKYKMKVFYAKIKDKKDFDDPEYETKDVDWLTIDDFRELGRPSQLHIVEYVYNLIKKTLLF